MPQIRVSRSGLNSQVVTADSNMLAALKVAREQHGSKAEIEQVGTHTFGLRGVPFTGLVPPMFLAVVLP